MKKINIYSVYAELPEDEENKYSFIIDKYIDDETLEYLKTQIPLRQEGSEKWSYSKFENRKETYIRINQVEAIQDENGNIFVQIEAPDYSKNVEERAKSLHLF